MNEEKFVAALKGLLFVGILFDVSLLFHCKFLYLDASPDVIAGVDLSNFPAATGWETNRLFKMY